MPSTPKPEVRPQPPTEAASSLPRHNSRTWEFAASLGLLGLIASLVAIACGLIASIPLWSWALAVFGLIGNVTALVVLTND